MALSRYEKLLEIVRSTENLDQLSVKDGMVLHHNLLQELHQCFVLDVNGERAGRSLEISGTGFISTAGLRVWKFLLYLRQNFTEAREPGHFFALSAAKLFRNICRASPILAKEAVYGMVVTYSAIQWNGWGGGVDFNMVAGKCTSWLLAREPNSQPYHFLHSLQTTGLSITRILHSYISRFLGATFYARTPSHPSKTNGYHPALDVFLEFHSYFLWWGTIPMLEFSPEDLENAVASSPQQTTVYFPGGFQLHGYEAKARLPENRSVDVAGRAFLMERAVKYFAAGESGGVLIDYERLAHNFHLLEQANLCNNTAVVLAWGEEYEKDHDATVLICSKNRQQDANGRLLPAYRFEKRPNPVEQLVHFEILFRSDGHTELLTQDIGLLVFEKGTRILLDGITEWNFDDPAEILHELKGIQASISEAINLVAADKRKALNIISYQYRDVCGRFCAML
ncbi:hypothetical protein ABW20_dc0106388 [Dactylellina cionopaga]|nr:hypothetical protein ABW20_dc0106388 [Dactylellina cionopaga]